MHRYELPSQRLVCEDSGDACNITYLCQVLVEPLDPVHSLSVANQLQVLDGPLPEAIPQGLCLALLEGELLLQLADLVFELSNP